MLRDTITQAGSRFTVRPLAIALGFLIVPLLLAAFLGWHARLMADDYCTMSLGRDQGVIGGLVAQYNEWSGQPTNILTKNAIGIIGTDVIPLLAPLLLLGLCASCAWMLMGVLGGRSIQRAGFIVGADVDTWVNRCAAQWYRVETVRTG
ncbi:MAG: hypothetical protein SGJ24_02565 [Chloroflexota bacterium]|nr:hypothetical protein [Chloroflexota bacterium]